MEQLVRGSEAFLDAVLRPDVARILLIDAPAVLGLARFTELDERYAVAATVVVIEAAVAAARSPSKIPTPWPAYGWVCSPGVGCSSPLPLTGDDPSPVAGHESPAVRPGTSPPAEVHLVRHRRVLALVIAHEVCLPTFGVGLRGRLGRRQETHTFDVRAPSIEIERVELGGILIEDCPRRRVIDGGVVEQAPHLLIGVEKMMDSKCGKSTPNITVSGVTVAESSSSNSHASIELLDRERRGPIWRFVPQ